jgi:hypothetical protein
MHFRCSLFTGIGMWTWSLYMLIGALWFDGMLFLMRYMNNTNSGISSH